LLLDAVEDEARRRGWRELRLDTRADLSEARALYTRHGYAEIPRYNDNPWAQHWYAKPLPPPTSSAPVAPGP
jgi:ribosomal protein S18 acetylase RimI-like enzyme